MAVAAISFVGCVEPRDTPLDAEGIGSRDGAAGSNLDSNDAAESPSQDSAVEAPSADSKSETPDGRDSATGADAGVETSHADDARASDVRQDAAVEAWGGGDVVPADSGVAGAGGSTCPYKANYGEVVIANNLMVTAEQVTPTSPGQPDIDEALWNGIVRNISATPDQITIDLVSERSPFDGALQPMKVDLSSQHDFRSCGACVVFFVTADADGALLPQSETFIPISGELNIVAVPTFPAIAGSRIAGSLSKVVFEHVYLDPMTDEATKIDSCQISLTSAYFDAPVEDK